VNQRTAPTGLTADGGKWRFLGAVNATKGWLQVKLTNAANGTVVADAIRLVHVPSGASFQLSTPNLVGLAPTTAVPSSPGFAGAFTNLDTEESPAPMPATSSKLEQSARSSFSRQASAGESQIAASPLCEQTIELLSRSRSRPQQADLLDLALDSLLASDW
jgi:hypothetical protein